MPQDRRPPRHPFPSRGECGSRRYVGMAGVNRCRAGWFVVGYKGEGAGIDWVLDLVFSSLPLAGDLIFVFRLVGDQRERGESLQGFRGFDLHPEQPAMRAFARGPYCRKPAFPGFCAIPVDSRFCPVSGLACWEALFRGCRDFHQRSRTRFLVILFSSLPGYPYQMPVHFSAFFSFFPYHLPVYLL